MTKSERLLSINDGSKIEEERTYSLYSLVGAKYIIRATSTNESRHTARRKPSSKQYQRYLHTEVPVLIRVLRVVGLLLLLLLLRLIMITVVMMVLRVEMKSKVGLFPFLVMGVITLRKLLVSSVVVETSWRLLPMPMPVLVHQLPHLVIILEISW